MILIDQILNFAEIKLNVCVFAALQTAELFQAEWTSLTKKIDEFAVRTLQLFYTKQMDHNSYR